MSRYSSAFLVILVAVFILIHTAMFAGAAPILTSAGASGFTAENSSTAAMTFTANPISEDDESIINVNFVSSPPAATSSITVRVKLGSGSFTTIPSGTDITAIANHTVHYTLNTANPSTPSMEILIVHEHTGPVAEIWHVRLENMGETSKYTVSAADYATFTNIHLLPTVLTTTDYDRDERSPALTLGGSSGSNIWPAVTATTLSYQWTQDSGPAITFPSMTSSTLQVLPSPATELPSVSTQTTYVFTLEVTDTVSDPTFAEHGSMVDEESVTLFVKPISGKDVMLILDHSGSMLSEDKWEITRQAASLFIDLFRALRNDDADAGESAEKSKIGHLKFESSSCGWTASPTPEAAGDLVVGLSLTNLDSLGAFQPVDSSYPSAPWGCTPIGDGLDLAKSEFNSDGTSGRDNPIFVVMTDGLENSGKLKISDVHLDVPSWPALLRNATFYTLGVGKNSVEESELQNLASLTGGANGVYRKATELADQQVQEFFVEMLGDIIEAQQIPPETGGTDTNQDFVVNQGETRIAFILLWDRAAPGAAAYYPKLSLSSTWANDINWNNASGFSNVRKSHQVVAADGYAFMVVDWTAEDSIQGLWSVSFAQSDGTVVTVPAAAHPRIIALADPLLYADFSFDQNVHNTGDPIILKADISEGGQPVLGADVRVELVQPTEGEGTFLSENADQYDPPGKPPRIAGDALTPKKVMLTGLLAQMGKDSLGTKQNSIQLLDDGAHQDGDKDDGLYANTFTDTGKEGTYTFRYTATGTANSGTPFGRLGTKCNYVRVNVDPSSSPSSSQTLSPSGGLNRVEFFITPKDSEGEYLGPFRGEQVEFKVTGGTLVGDVIDHRNGTYSQVIAYSKGNTVVVVPVVDGKPFPPLSVDQPQLPIDLIHIIMITLLLVILIFTILIYRIVVKS